MICSWVNGFVEMKKLPGIPVHLTSRQCICMCITQSGP